MAPSWAESSKLPRRKKRRARRSCRSTTGAARVLDDRHVQLPRIGVVRTNEVLENPRALSRHARRRARLRRELARRQKGSGCRQQTEARPNRAALDASPGELRCHLVYKLTWHDATYSTLVVADRRFASSETCSSCGSVEAEHSLATRTCRCERCGLEIDRDLNAAHNLAAYGRRRLDVAGSGPETQHARGGPHPRDLSKPPAKREGGTGRPGRTAPPRRKMRLLGMVTFDGGSGNGGPCADPGASWGRRKSDTPVQRDELLFDYALKAATTVVEEGGPAVPELCRRILVTSCAIDPPQAFVPVLERLARSPPTATRAV